MKESDRILVLIPGKNARGGITNYYSSIRKHLPDRIIYFRRGSRNWPNKKNVILELYRLVSDYTYYTYCLLFKKISIVQTNTAFYKASIIRDGIFIFIAQRLGKKTIVFFRGWNDKYVDGLSGLSLRLFKLVYFNTNLIIDLSNHNVNILKKLGYKNRIHLETTVVDDELLTNVRVESLISKRFNSCKKTILFISRIEKEKGIYKLLETFIEIKLRDDNFDLVFAGDGNELQNLKEIVQNEIIKDVQILGFVEGKQKKELFKRATVFVFLSDFEGMPNAVLEAMAFGLPVITTDVGGIASVFKDSHNGFLIDTFYKKELVKKIKYMVYDKEFYTRVSINNFKESKKKTMSSIVAKRLIDIYKEVARD